MINTFRSLSCNFLGKSIATKVVVIESDDWGSIRMPSAEAYMNLYEREIPVEKSVYCKFDGLETNGDIELLLSVLKRVNNIYQKKVLVTLNFVTANPDFAKISNSNYEQYYSESIVDTYKSYSQSDTVLNQIDLGTKEGFFLPQFHGREHVNVPFWLELLNTNKNFQIGFDQKLFGLSSDVFPNLKKSVQATYDTCDLEYQNESITEGLSNFQKIFGFKSKSFISNNYILSDTSFNTLVTNGVEIIQGMKYQKLPLENDAKKRRLIRRRNGDVASLGRLRFTIRNCSFEPTELGDTVESTLQQIKIAFLMNKPAVISTHRINYTSRLSTENRDKNINLFEELLNRIIQTWPEVEFTSSINLFNKKQF